MGRLENEQDVIKNLMFSCHKFISMEYHQLFRMKKD